MEITYESIMAMFQETANSMKKLNEFQEKTAKFQEKTAEFQEKTAEEKRKADEEFKEYQRKMAEELRESQKKTDEQIKNVSRRLGDIGNRLGDFVEDFVEPAVLHLFKERGIDIHFVTRNFRSPELKFEIDLLVINTDCVIAVECKSRITSDQIEKHIKRMEKVKQAFPTKRCMGAIFSMVFDAELQQEAEQEGFFVLCQNGADLVQIANEPDFQPKV